MTKNSYHLSIQHPNWGHSVNTFSTKEDAIKAANKLIRMGSSWTDTEPAVVLKHCNVCIHDSVKDTLIYSKPFSKKYLASLK